MERIHVKGNTWCLAGRQYIPYYVVGEGGCILLDAGKVNELAAMEAALKEAGLTPRAILLTHMHYDHNENTKYFCEKHGIPALMPRIEAEICRNEQTLKNHLFCFSPGLIAESERLQNLVNPNLQPIEEGETQVTILGHTFDILPTPGHSPGHVAIVTPDGVCYLGDAVLAGEDLKRAKIPFAFGVAADLETKRAMKGLNYDRYIAAHRGIIDDFLPLLEENISLIETQADFMAALITEPMNFCTCYEVINAALDQADNHPVWNLHLERYLRPYLEYLVDAGKIQLVKGKGAPTLAPLGWQP